MRVADRSSSTRFAAIVPVGPGALGLWRGVQVIKSLCQHEDGLGWCIFIEDASQPRGLADLVCLTAKCRVVVLRNARQRHGGSWVGGLTGGILTALSWINQNTDASFVLRIDADALVIGPFADFIRAFVTRVPEAGVIGTLGLSCNPHVRAKQDLGRQSKLLKAYRRWPVAPSIGKTTPKSQAAMVIPGFVHPVTVTDRRALDRLRPHLAQAIRRGYFSSEYCQGGVCVITRAMVDEMAEAGYLGEFRAWECLRVPDDMVLAMYARALGLRLCDCSAPGEPFGVQHRGLPYPPEELVARGHSLIHSVKGDPVYSEAAIRQYFDNRSNRQSGSLLEVS